MELLIINGPNLNMLGKRDPAYYGEMTLDELNASVNNYCAERGVVAKFFFSNSEGAIIDVMQMTRADGIILNAGAYSHYSYAIADCVECISAPVVEVHLSDITSREPFRRIRVLEKVAVACFYGKKEKSYYEAVDYFVNSAAKSKK